MFKITKKPEQSPEKPVELVIEKGDVGGVVKPRHFGGEARKTFAGERWVGMSSS